MLRSRQSQGVPRPEARLADFVLGLLNTATSRGRRRRGPDDHALEGRQIVRATSPNPAPCVRTAWLLALAAAVGLVGLGLYASAADRTSAGQELQVIDGDTLQSGAEVIQLYGIDAPELGQICRRDGKPWTCGLDAALALQKLVSLSGSPVVCKEWRELPQTKGPDGELIRVCLVGADQDLAQAMLRNGYVMALPGSFPYYGQLERQARQAGLGIWSSDFQPPWEWRQAKHMQLGATERPGIDCNVKARVSAAGDRIYVVPTDADYEHPAAGAADRQRFCSDEAARAAGWRRPGESAGSAVR
jgi:endonuclease YncB( thermonuclease family)